MKDQPDWQAWTEIRTLNKIFKRQIEGYYARHYFKYMCIKIDGGMHYDEDVGNMALQGRFDLAHSKASIVTFRDDEVAKDFSGMYEGAMKRAMYPLPTWKTGPN